MSATNRPLIDEVLQTALLMGLALVALVPAVREAQTVFGWLPLWLVGMPAATLLVRLTVMRRGVDAAPGRTARPSAFRRPAAGVQARRRPRRTPRDRVQHSA